MSSENGLTPEDIQDLMDHSTSFEWFIDENNWIRINKLRDTWRVSWTDPSAPKARDDDPIYGPNGPLKGTYRFHPYTHELPSITMAYYFVRGLRQGLDILGENP